MTIDIAQFELPEGWKWVEVLCIGKKETNNGKDTVTLFEILDKDLRDEPMMIWGKGKGMNSIRNLTPGNIHYWATNDAEYRRKLGAESRLPRRCNRHGLDRRETYACL